MNVYDTANRLAAEIKESEEYTRFKAIKEQIYSNPELKEKIEQFEKARYEMQVAALQGGKPLEEKSTQIQNLYAELIQNEQVKDYFDSEIKFNVLLADVNKIIGEAIKDLIR